MSNKKYKMEVWDMMHDFFKSFNDHMMHASLTLSGKLNVDVLKKAVSQTFNLLPIFKSVLVINPLKGYWVELKNIDINTVVTYAEKKSDSDVDDFLVGFIDEKCEPQMKIKVFGEGTHDTIAFLINHMVFDGKGFKDYMTLLSTIYSNLLIDENYICTDKINPNRGFDTLFKSFTKQERKMLKTRTSQGKPNDQKVGFPFSSSATDVFPKINKLSINSTTFEKLKAYSKTIGVTLNDMIIASLIRSLKSVVTTDKSIDIDCIVDLRKHLKDVNVLGYTNFVSKIVCDIGSDIGETLLDTIKKVHAVMDKCKNDYAGLDGLSLLMTGYNLLPHCLAKIAVTKKYSNPLVAVSNIGIIDDSKINFDKLKITDVYMTGSIKRNPYIQLALTTFKNAITFTIALYGSEADHLMANKLLTLVESNLNSLITN